MTDLVKRLREYHPKACPDLQDAWEAADRIETLLREGNVMRRFIENIANGLPIPEMIQEYAKDLIEDIDTGIVSGAHDSDHERLN